MDFRVRRILDGTISRARHEALASSVRLCAVWVAVVAAGAPSVICAQGPADADAVLTTASSATMQGQQTETAAAATDTLTGTWGGTRTQLRDAGIELTGTYKGELVGDVQGEPASRV